MIHTTVGLLEPATADDDGLVAQIAELINTVYVTAERGLWRDGATRTTVPELAALIRAGEIAVATQRGQIVGSVRIHDVAADASEFGMWSQLPIGAAPASAGSSSRSPSGTAACAAGG